MILIKLILIVLIILAGVFSYAHWMESRYRLVRMPDELLYATTKDGWKLALSRYLPKGKRKKTPIICCHGLAGNHFGFDFTDSASVTKALTEEGYDVFLLDLRGAGWSEKPRRLSPFRYDWRFEDHVYFDAPAAINKVLEITGAQKVHWIGHSMGGMIAYALSQTDIADKIASFTAIDSPATFDQYKKIASLQGILRIFPVLHVRFISLLGTPFFMGKEGFFNKVSGAIDIEPGMGPYFIVNFNENVPMTLIQQFADWIRNNQVSGSDGKNYIEGLEKIDKPFLFTSGDEDFTAVPASVRFAYDKCGSKDKKLLTFGKASGSVGPYGHLTPLIGKNAAKEVYPLLVSWLNAH